MQELSTSRRKFLVWSVGAATLSVLQACSSAAPPAAAPAATVAPPAAAGAAPATPTAASAAAAAATPTVASAAQATTAPAAQAAPAAGKTNVRFSTWIGVLKPQADLFNQTHNDINVVFEQVPYATHADKLLTEIAAGTAPDAFQVAGEFWIPMLPKQVTYPLDDLLKTDNVDMTGWTIDPHKHSEYNGKLWALPLHIPVGRGLAYNKKLFDKAGVSYPKPDWTWDDINAVLPKLHQPPASYGMTAPTDLYTYQEAVRSNGSDVIAADNSKCLLDSPEAIEAVQTVVDWLVKLKATMAPGGEKALGDQAFASDKLALYVTVQTDWDTWNTITNKQTVDAWITRLPVSPKTKTYVYSADSHAVGVWSKTKAVDQAASYVFWSLTDPGSTAIQVKLFPTAYRFTDFLAKIPDEKQKSFEQFGVDSVPFYKPFYWGPNNTEIKNAFMAERDLALLGQKPVPDAMKSATQAINAILQGS